MSEINYGVSASLQNRFIVHGDNRLQSNDVVPDNLSKEQLDSVEISDEAFRQQNENASLDKKLEALMHHFMEQFSNPKSLDMYRVDNPFKMELRASSGYGGKNLFQDYSECQYKVFDRWIKENASVLSEKTCAKIQETVKSATMAMDKFNVMSGYRGTSFESVANNIMERMTPNYMYEDIGKSTQFLRNKNLIQIFPIDEFVTCYNHAGEGKNTLFLIRYLFCQIHNLF